MLVLQEANIGPFGAQLIQATDADALYAWLGEQGYLQDPKARPILDEYVKLGAVFLGLKLQNGKSTGDLRPIQLNLGDTDQCVPLRLTAIAATANLPMLVWVLGEHRAVPKNFMSALVNPAALNWPSVNNYVQVVTDAVNSVMGRAFVTEYASDARILDGAFWNEFIASARDQVQEAETLSELSAVAQQMGGINDAELGQLLRTYVPMPTDLRGYPFGNCYYDPSGAPGFGPPDCEDNAGHVTTEAEFYGFLGYWITQTAAPPEGQGLVIEADLAGLKEGLLSSWFAPRERIQGMLDEARWITRFFTTISDDEMIRDPIFAFNKDLPPVDPAQVLDVVVKATDACETTWMEVTYPTGDTITLPCQGFGCSQSIPAVEGAPALLEVQVIDEQGQPQPFDPNQSEEVDQILAAAVPGDPSVPSWFDLAPPPDRPIFGNNSGLPVPSGAGPLPGTGGLCSLSRTAPASGALAGLALLGLAFALLRKKLLA